MWLQRLIACAVSIGIGKKELMEDYYIDEIGDVLSEWNKLHSPQEEKPTTVDPITFLGGDGEWVTG